MKTKMDVPTMEWIFDRAVRAGQEALKRCRPNPMVVEQRADPFDDTSEVKEQWIVEGGPCGFAWVNVKPGTSRFARWLKKEGHGRADSYYGGVTVWVSDGGQSMARKEAYAHAMAKVLNQFLDRDGVKAQPMSRMD